MKSLFEEMGGTYTLGADGMYYPDLELPEEEPHYGKYGRMRLRYLKEHHKMLYNTLLLDGELVKHLNEVDDTANQRMELLTLQMQEQQGINEALKARDQMLTISSAEDELFIQWENVEILKSLHNLDEPMREVMYLRLIGEISFAQIGEIIGKSENWARVNFYRGKKRIFEEMKKNE